MASLQVRTTQPSPVAWRGASALRAWRCQHAMALIAGLLYIALAHAQAHERTTKLAQGTFTLRSSVVQSTDISELSARERGITPSPRTAVLDVVLLREEGERRVAVPVAEIDAKVRDLLGASHSVALQQVRANQGVSYVSTFTYEPAEVLDFTISARAGESTEPIVLRFRERMPARKP